MRVSSLPPSVPAACRVLMSSRAEAKCAVAPRAPTGAGDSAAAVQTVLEQQGLGRIIHKPDGTIIWEPLPEGKPSEDFGLRKVAAQKLLCMLEVTASVVLATSGVVAAGAAWQHVDRAYATGTTLTSGQLTNAVTHTVASTVAGLITGAVLGPIRAATHLIGKAARPLAFGFAIHRGVIWVRRNLAGGVAHLIRRLLSGNLKKMRDALRAIASRALSSEAFRKEFARFAGVQALLQVMEDALAIARLVPGMLPPGMADGSAQSEPPLLQLLLQALEALLHSSECKDACVNAGGVPLLLNYLAYSSATPIVQLSSIRTEESSRSFPTMGDALRRSNSNSTVSSFDSTSDLSTACCAGKASTSKRSSGSGSGTSTEPDLLALSCLTHLSTHPAARDAIRELGGLPIIVGMVSKQHMPVAGQAITLMQALACDSSSKDAMGLGGGVPALLAVATSSAPNSKVQGAALATLQTLLKGSPANQLALAHVPNSFSRISASHATLGPVCSFCKTGMQDLLSLLSRFPSALPCHSAAVSPKSTDGSPTAGAGGPTTFQQVVGSMAACPSGSPMTRTLSNNVLVYEDEGSNRSNA